MILEYVEAIPLRVAFGSFGATMRDVGGQILFSATDLMRFMGWGIRHKGPAAHNSDAQGAAQPAAANLLQQGAERPRAVLPAMLSSRL